jgi:signal recognition particle subunit SRP54
LIEKATEEIDETEAMNMMEKMMSGNFNYNDLLKQMKMIRRMGKFSGILKMLPGLGSLADMDKVDDKQMDFIEPIISSMTPEERKNPALLNMSSSRRNRVARGSGRSTTEVNRLITMLEKQTKLFRQMQGMNPKSMETMSQNVAQGNFQPKQSRADRRKNKK